ncbi:hypothetical protein KDA_74750 [Dictyobacter alpinus]|uniref:PD-(D/E)XK endonuclease-like domain-containing protein n=1 Tax=Dictyobacter alpinus TaxID=2014873 RepID=A0A402BKX4_9CHLR|nr:PD-(D/E)XK nuclease family protein [Dictyobacter alpinus]GCE31991.1 hypothetical protein KDA_74750 [Dictyobacter alpinus]
MPFVLDEVTSTILKERPLSVSQLRTFDRCPKSYELQYLTNPRTPVLDMGAAVWFGKVIQQIIQRAYHEVPLLEGHLQVWQQECGPIFEDLQDWFHLDVASRKSGAANSHARKDWNQAHPEYKTLTARIDAHQQEYLSNWNWSEKYPLTAYYRWSATFARTTPMSQIVLPYAALVEGLPVRWPDGEVIRRFDGEDGGREHYKLLHGVIGGAHVVGVPDQFGVDPDGTAWISDNKVTASQLSSEELGYDSQLAVYYILLRQNTWITDGQPTRVGHCYIKEKEPPRYEWSDISHYDDLVLPQLHDHFAQLKAAIVKGQFLRVRGIQPAAFSPCKFCGVRYACLTPQDHIEREVTK